MIGPEVNDWNWEVSPEFLKFGAVKLKNGDILELANANFTTLKKGYWVPTA